MDYPLTAQYQVPTLWQSLQYMMFTGIAIASASPIVARIWRSYKDLCDKELPESYETPCEYKYPIEEALDDGDIPTSSYVMEYTPNGTVLMKYNTDNEQFEYWGGRQVHYKYLETVARKFVTSFHCSRIYHDWNPYQKETCKANDTADTADTADTTDTTIPTSSENTTDENHTKANDSVFATFKPYNSKDQTRKNQKIRNHYVHKGTLSEWYALPMTQTSTTENVGINFSTYKAMFFR